MAIKIPPGILKKINDCFLENSLINLEQMQHERTVLGGDYDLYMNPRLDKLDKMPEHHDNQNCREDITSFLEINNLVDV